jgi:hypothetical protein
LGWNGFFTNRLDSREYVADSEGYHVLAKEETDCPGEGRLMRVRLVEEQFFGDKEYQWRLLECNDTNQNRSWLASGDGDHHFTIEKEDTDSTRYYWYVAGQMDYP